MKRWEDEFALHTSGERLQMRGGSRMRSYMEEREMSMDGQITLKSLGIKTQAREFRIPINYD